MLYTLVLGAQELGVVYRDDFFEFKGDVCKLTLRINYWDQEEWSYWYDAEG